MTDGEVSTSRCQPSRNPVRSRSQGVELLRVQSVCKLGCQNLPPGPRARADGRVRVPCALWGATRISTANRIEQCVVEGGRLASRLGCSY